MVKIYVGNLNSDVNSEDLREIFETYGQIENCERVKGKPYGFVHMRDENAARMAVRKLTRSNIKGSRVTVEISSRKPQKFYIGNLNRDTTDEDLRDLFENEGACVVDAEKCEDKKIGFVRVENQKGYREMQQLVKNLNGAILRGNQIIVEFSEDKSYESKVRENMQPRMCQFPAFEEDIKYGYRPCLIANSPNRRQSPMPPFMNAWGPSMQNDHINKIIRGRGYLQSDYFDRQMNCGSEDSSLLTGPNSRTVNSTENIIGDIKTKYRSELFERGVKPSLHLYETGLLSDYQLHCDGTTFHVHKAILAIKSPVLSRNIISGVNSIHDVDVCTMRVLLQFIYSGVIDVVDMNPSRILKLLSAANIYQVELVKEGLEAALVDNINEDSAVDYLIFSEELQLADLKKVVKHFICDRAARMKERTDFKSKLQQYPHLIFELFDEASN